MGNVVSAAALGSLPFDDVRFSSCILSFEIDVLITEDAAFDARLVDVFLKLFRSYF